MALTLREAITATQTTIDITGTDELNAGDVWSIDSEYLKIHGEPFFPAGQFAYQRASVKRGVQGTPKASHAAGAGLTNRLPGTGGTSVHGELDEREAADGHPIAAVTGLEDALAALATVVTDTTVVFAVDTTDTDATLTGGFPGAFEAGQVGWLVSGVGIPSGATIASVPGDGTTAEMSAPATATGNVEVRLSEPAPSPTVAGMLWRRGEGAAAAYSVRDAADADWIPLGPAYYNTDGRLHAFVGYDIAGGNLRMVHYGGDVPAEIVLQSDGTVVVGNFAGGIEISTTGAIALTGTAFTFLGLPTADPAVAGALWNNAGVLMVSAG